MSTFCGPVFVGCALFLCAWLAVRVSPGAHIQVAVTLLLSASYWLPGIRDGSLTPV